jgi:dipeptide/tripeptide permease
MLYSLAHLGERRPGEGFFGPARRKFGDEAAEGPPAVLRIIVVFSMVSVFWALFDQHSSTWVEQAKQMDLTLTLPARVWTSFAIPATLVVAVYGGVWLFTWVANRTVPRAVTYGVFALVAAWGAGSVVAQLVSPAWESLTLQPAQIAGLNPLFVMIIIPLLNVAVYGPLERRGRPLRPLVRMGIGMFLAAAAFVTVALLQARIEAVGKGQLHVLWQVIPFFLMTVSEVLVSVTGLEFAYTQAPRSMKSTIMGFWLLCVFFGDILVAMMAPLMALSLSHFFWVFSVAMAVAAALFTLLASFYKGKTFLQA